VVVWKPELAINAYKINWLTSNMVRVKFTHNGLTVLETKLDHSPQIGADIRLTHGIYRVKYVEYQTKGNKIDYISAELESVVIEGG
jgi:hypothetical protein